MSYKNWAFTHCGWIDYPWLNIFSIGKVNHKYFFIFRMASWQPKKLLQTTNSLSEVLPHSMDKAFMMNFKKDILESYRNSLHKKTKKKTLLRPMKGNPCQSWTPYSMMWTLELINCNQLIPNSKSSVFRDSEFLELDSGFCSCRWQQ